MSNNKRKQENDRVRIQIEEALFSLMEQKSFSSITVSDIVRESGVARATYYRNYESKEDVVISYFDRLHQKAGESFSLTAPPSSREEARLAVTPENVTKSLEFYLAHKYYLLLLHEAGFGALLQDELNRIAEEALGDMPANSIERYRIYLVSGALYNVMMQWLREGAPESPAALARAICAMLGEAGQSK